MQRLKQTNEQLCALAQQGDTDAQNLLIENNLGFIQKTAYETWSTQKELNQSFHIEMDDLIQEGTWSLYGCIDRFDPAKELQFITYYLCRYCHPQCHVGLYPFTGHNL